MGGPRDGEMDGYMIEQVQKNAGSRLKAVGTQVFTANSFSFSLFENVYNKILGGKSVPKLLHKGLFLETLGGLCFAVTSRRWRAPGTHTCFWSPGAMLGAMGWMTLAELQVSEANATCMSTGPDQVSGPDAGVETIYFFEFLVILVFGDFTN